MVDFFESIPDFFEALVIIVELLFKSETVQKTELVCQIINKIESVPLRGGITLQVLETSSLREKNS